jgi:hypothetical protein
MLWAISCKAERLLIKSPCGTAQHGFLRHLQAVADRLRISKYSWQAAHGQSQQGQKQFKFKSSVVEVAEAVAAKAL